MSAAACGDGGVDSPFQSDAETPEGGDAGLDASDAGDASEDPTLGGPCLDDGQCDDDVDCTADVCDKSLGRCRFTPNHATCVDDVFCDGEERCDPKLGCVEGDPIPCSDDSSCTIDVCVEATRSCRHEPRDADGDGDPVWNCGQGGDCNDANPRVSSLDQEICNNQQDDDCDQEIDEPGCVTAAHDTCGTALEVNAEGNYGLDFVAAALDYPSTCFEAGGAWRDVVLAVTIPEGDPVDADLVLRAEVGQLGLAARTQCSSLASEFACDGGYALGSGAISRLRLSGLGPGVYPVFAFANRDVSAVLKVSYVPTSAPPDNTSCGTSTPLPFGEHVLASPFRTTTDLNSACGSSVGDQVYVLEVPAPSDLRVFAASIDGYGAPNLSLRGPACVTLTDELTCRLGDPTELFWRGLAAGSYFLRVSANGPAEVDVVALLEPPSVPPADEQCAGSPALNPNTTVEIDFADHVNDVSVGCVNGAVDLARSLALNQPSDLLLMQELSAGDRGGISLAHPECSSQSHQIGCGTGTSSPVRRAISNVPAGSYRVVVESDRALPSSITALRRPATSPLSVLFADGCSDAFQIPAGGARLVGNTAGASADFEASCDFGIGGAGGAPDQLLKLSLNERRRVVLDMTGSAYTTLLSVRSGGCPGSEIVGGCANGTGNDQSFLDLVLDAGEYTIQVDGYADDRGPWQLNVFSVPP